MAKSSKLFRALPPRPSSSLTRRPLPRPTCSVTSSRCLATVNSSPKILPEIWFTGANPLQNANEHRDHKPPNERDVKLGKSMVTAPSCTAPANSKNSSANTQGPLANSTSVSSSTGNTLSADQAPSFPFYSSTFAAGVGEGGLQWCVTFLCLIPYARCILMERTLLDICRPDNSRSSPFSLYAPSIHGLENALLVWPKMLTPRAAALWTSPITWGRIPLVNVKLEIISQRVSKSHSPYSSPILASSSAPERLVVKWRTVGKTKHKGVGGFYQGIGARERVDKITEWLGGGRGEDDKHEFTGLFFFEFDHEGRIVSHTIEHAQEGGNWEKGVGAKVVGLTDWLLGGMKNGNGAPCPACCAPQEDQRQDRGKQ